MGPSTCRWAPSGVGTAPAGGLTTQVLVKGSGLGLFLFSGWTFPSLLTDVERWWWCAKLLRLRPTDCSHPSTATRLEVCEEEINKKSYNFLAFNHLKLTSRISFQFSTSFNISFVCFLFLSSPSLISSFHLLTWSSPCLLAIFLFVQVSEFFILLSRSTAALLWSLFISVLCAGKFCPFSSSFPTSSLDPPYTAFEIPKSFAHHTRTDWARCSNFGVAFFSSF